jgi:hypothetical protein
MYIPAWSGIRGRKLHNSWTSKELERRDEVINFTFQNALLLIVISRFATSKTTRFRLRVLTG